MNTSPNSELGGLETPEDAQTDRGTQVVNLLGAYERYKEYKRKQHESNAKFSDELRKQYDEERKKLPDYLQMRALYMPPVVNTMPESFSDFMSWLRRDAEVNGLVPPDDKPTQTSSKKPQSSPPTNKNKETHE